MNILLIILAIAYILLPYDLLPDFFPVRGWIDDLIIAGLLIYKYFQRQKARQTTDRTNNQGHNQHSHKETDPAGSGLKDLPPHQILGVAPDASDQQIKSAYRHLAAKYHPDKFTHLDEEFRCLAEERFKQIQAAYQTMKSSRKI